LNPVREATGATTVDLLAGLRIDEYLTRTTGGTTEYLLSEALGSTIALADGSGAVATAYSYEPFGTATASGTSSSNEFGYTGREDDGTGLRYYRARYYHPSLQRFTSEDPIRLASGVVNFYAYALNNPITATDPLGLWTFGLGIQASGTLLFAGGSLSFSIVRDGHGQIGLVGTGGLGSAGSSGLYSGSLILQGQGTNADSIDQLRGWGGTTSLSIQARNLVGQSEFFAGDGYSGFAGGLGVGVPGGGGFTMSGELTRTGVLCLAFCLGKQPPLSGRKN
jgi:RHS repeat-associated protein